MLSSLFYLRAGYCLSSDHVCNWLDLLGCIKGRDSFLSLPSPSGLPERRIAFWFNAYSIIKLFSFFSSLMERFSGLGGEFVFNSISPTPTRTKHLKQHSWRISLWCFVKSSGGSCQRIIGGEGNCIQLSLHLLCPKEGEASIQNQPWKRSSGNSLGRFWGSGPDNSGGSFPLPFLGKQRINT